jgi:hypothetical protein
MKSSGDINLIKKQRSKEHKAIPDNEQHIENFIQSISPFKDLMPNEALGMRKEMSMGLGGGFAEVRKRRATLKIAEPQLGLLLGKGATRGNRNEDNAISRELGRSGSSKQVSKKSFKRSTTLLSNIKEVHKAEEEGVGVVPNDLTYDFLKDLIAEQEREEQKKHSKNESMVAKQSAYKNKKSSKE